MKITLEFTLLQRQKGGFIPFDTLVQTKDWPIIPRTGEYIEVAKSWDVPVHDVYFSALTGDITIELRLINDVNAGEFMIDYQQLLDSGWRSFIPRKKRSKGST